MKTCSRSASQPRSAAARRLLVAIAALPALATGASAQTWTNNATGNTTWSTSSNWDTSAPTSGNTTVVNFYVSGTTLGTGGNVTAFNDLSPNPLVVNQLNFFGTGPATGGTTLNLNGNGIAFDGTNAQLNVNGNFGGSGYTVNITNALTFNTATAINFSNGGAFINTTGAWSGAGNVTFTGQLNNRPLTLTANSTSFSGDVTLVGASTVLALTGANSALGPNTSTTQSVIVGNGAGVTRDYGNAAYTNSQNFILNGNGNLATSNASLNVIGLGFGTGSIGGLAVNTNSTIRVQQNIASETRGINLSRGIVGTGDLIKTGNAWLNINAVAGNVTWGGTAYSLFTGNITINEGVVQTPGNTNFSLGSGTTQTVLVNSGAAFVHGSGDNACTNPQNFVINGSGTGYIVNGGSGIAAFSTPNAGFGSNTIGSLSLQSDSSVSVLRTATRGNIGLALTRGLFGNGTLSLNNVYGANFGVMFVGNGTATTQSTSAGTFSTFGGKVAVNNAALVLTGTNALGANSGNQVYLSGAGAFGGDGSAAVNQTFLNRIENRSTTSGTLAIGAANSNALDFTGTPNLRLGSTSSSTYSGALTPGSNGYRLGGGGGTLTVSSNLTGSNSLNVGGTVTLTGAGNTFNGGITIAGVNTAADHVARLNYTGGTGVLPTNNLTFAGIGGTFAYTGAAAGSSQSIGTLTFSDGVGTVLSTYGTSGNTSLSFSGLAARSSGSVGSFTVTNGVNGSTNKISITGLATGFVDKGIYFAGSNYAYNDATGYLRAPVYGTDAGFVTSSTTATLSSSTHQQITGNITAQNTATFTTLRLSGNAPFNLASSQTVTVDGILKAGGTAVTIAGGSGIQASSGSEMVINNVDDLTISTAVLNNGGSSLTKVGAGTLTLSANNTYTGTTTVAQGTLTVSGSGRLADSSNVVVSGGTYNVSVSDTVNNVTLKNGIIGGSSTLTAASYDLQNGQVNAILAGSGGLTKNTEGLVLLTGNNTYSGATTINAGSLVVIGRGARIPTASAVNITASGASLDVSGITESTMTVGSLAGVAGSSVRIGAKSFNVGGDNSTTSFNGTLSGTGGSLVKAGTGVLTLSGNNTYTGVTTIGGTAGGIVVTANNALGTTAGNTTVASGTSLGLSGGVNFSAAETIIGSGTGTATGVGAFTAVQRGFVQSVSGNNTFAGAIQINATGVTRIGTQDGSQLTLTGPITAVSGATVYFRAGGNGDFVTLSNSGNSWNTDTQVFSSASINGGIRLGANNALPISVSIINTAGGGGAGTMLDLAGYNQEMNGLSLNNNTVIISNSNSGSTSVLTLNNAADKTTGVGTVVADGAGKIQLIKTGSFNQTLQNQNTYTGGTRVDNGTLTLGHATNTLANTGAVNINGGTLALGNNTDTVGAVTLTSGNITGSGNSTQGILTGTGTNYDVRSGSISAKLAGTVGLDKSTSGTVTLSGNNTYSGLTTVSDGVLNITSTGSLATGGNLSITGAGNATFANVGQTLGTVSNGNTLNFTAPTGDVTLASLAGGGTTTFSSNGTATISGGISNGTVNAVNGLLAAAVSSGTVNAASLNGAISGGAVTVSGLTTGAISGSGTLNTGSLISSSVTGGTNTVTGNATITSLSGGTTTIGGVATIDTMSGGTANLNGATSSISTLTGGNVALGGSTVLTVNGGTFGGTLTGGSLITGGNFTFASGSSFSGNATVSAGNTLVVDGIFTAGGITVNSGATLKGRGSVTGNTLVNGNLEPGNSPEKLSFAGNLTLTGTSVTVMELGGSVPTSEYDQISVAGSLTYGGTLNVVSWNGFDYDVAGNYNLFDSGSIAGSFMAVNVGSVSLVNTLGVWQATNGAGTFNYSFAESTGDLSVTAIPEPAAFASLAGFGALGLALYRRRKAAVKKAA